MGESQFKSQSQPKLTDRERQIMALVRERFTSKEIGRRLVLSPRTVDTHIANAVQKLGAGDRFEAAAALGRQASSRPPRQRVRRAKAAPEQRVIEVAIRTDYGTQPPLTDEASSVVHDPDHGRTDEIAGPPSPLSPSGAGGDESGLGGDGAGALDLPGLDLEPGGGGPPEPDGESGRGAGGPRSPVGLDEAGPVQTAGAGPGGTDPAGEGQPRPSAPGSRPRNAGGRNALSIPLRLAVIAAIAIGSALAFGGVVAALHALSALLPPLHR